MVKPQGPIMFPLGFIGLIGKRMYKIVEIKLRVGRFKKAVPADEFPLGRGPEPKHYPASDVKGQ